jgi:hypothetical protein
MLVEHYPPFEGRINKRRVKIQKKASLAAQQQEASWWMMMVAISALYW